MVKKENKATLIITEKPAAAEKIAAALSGATDEKMTSIKLGEVLFLSFKN